MRGVYSLLKSTLIGGLVVILPIAVLGGIVAWVIGMVVGFISPMLKWLPDQSIGGVSWTVLVATGAILGGCLLAGILAETALVRKLGGRAERLALFVPGYTLLKNVGANLVGIEGQKPLRTVLVRFDDSWAFGFLMSTLEDGRHAVFLPNAPNALTGRLRVMNADRVQLLAMTVSSALDVFSCLGVGLDEVWAKETTADV